MLTKELKNFLDHLPYRTSFYDEELSLIYSNSRADGSFFPSQDDEVLPVWIWQDIQQSADKSLHLQIPSDSFDQILMQSYQAIYDEENHFRGIYCYVQNLRPILSAYLKDSGQALVGWSDVTSGASIKNDLFDEI